ncbi:calcineurin-like phosphoesterase C-terminal domain-containing protein [Arenimonas composti]|nr:calcineurin-like phosphoesterase family protein [Arenimonas composti]
MTALTALPAAACSGRVFLDHDGDGRHDRGEPGLAGVAVSDGHTLVRTGADGRYRLPRGTALHFVVKPAGYVLGRRADGLPAHWARARGACADFALREDPRPAGELRVLLFADSQTRDAQEVEWFRRGIVERARITVSETVIRAGDGAGSTLPSRITVSDTVIPPALGVTLGDITNDDPALYPQLIEAVTSLGLPWLHAPGNHDVDLAAPADAGSLASFHAAFGPDTYAWEEAEASFIVFDDVIWQPYPGRKYIGGLREDQFAFLAAYLRDLPDDRPLVLAAHMPFFDDEPGIQTFRPADRERLFALLQRFEHVLLLTAHGHVQRHFFHEAGTGWHGARPLHEYNAGAACGSYWSGPLDADGIPLSTMADGTPKGWGELRLRGDGAYGLRWFIAEAASDPDTALALHAPQVLRRGSWPGQAVVANVFMGRADTRVEYRIDDGEWMPMVRVDQPDPRLLAENLRDDAAEELRAYDRLPEAAPSTHLWRGRLPTDLAAGEHRIEVRVRDPWRGEDIATTRYRLVDRDR